MTTSEIVDAMTRAAAGLQALPLDELPAVVGVQIRGFLPGELCVELQLRGSDQPAVRLGAWADALPSSVAVSVHPRRDYVHLDVAGLLERVPVVVWDHLTGPWAAHARDVFRLNEEPTRDAVLVTRNRLGEMAADEFPQLEVRKP